MADSPELLGRLDPDHPRLSRRCASASLIFDGAMGTNLQLLGLSPEDFGGPELEGCNEILISTRPDLIAQVHRSFYEVAATWSNRDVRLVLGRAGRVRPGRPGP